MKGHHVLVGNPKLLDEVGIPTSELEQASFKLSEEGKTPLLVAVDGTPAGVLAVADTLKEDSATAVSALHELGVQVVMITGDNRRTAAAIARQVGIERVLAEVLSEKKALEVQRLQAEGRRVAMVGDGINDAPALAQADIGMAIGTGADVAIEASDITLISGALTGIVTAIRLSQATMRNIRQNLFFAFGYNVVGIPIAAGVLYPFLGLRLSPIIAAAAMALSSLSVVSNAIRLRRFRPQPRRLRTPGGRPLSPRLSSESRKLRSQPGKQWTPCGMKVEALKAAGRTTYEGTIYYFCSKGCQEAFEAEPSAHAARPC